MTCRAFAVLAVTDGTTRINLLDCGRFHLSDWVPTVPGAKGGGTRQSSPLSSGSQLVDWQWEDWIEVFTLTLSGRSQDHLIYVEQELLRLLVKGYQYWTTDWQREQVWLEVKAPYESNERYAVIKNWQFPRGSRNPFAQPFTPADGKTATDVELTVQHGPWLDFPPGSVGDCDDVGEPYHLEFNATTSEVEVLDNAAIQDLHGADLTAEAWVRADGWGENNAGRIFDKTTVIAGGWRFNIDSVNGLLARAEYATGNAESRSGLDDFATDGEWHHVAMVLDYSASSKLIYLFVDGVEVTYTLQQDGGAGAVTTDVGKNLYIGNSSAGSRTWDGGIGWCRLSSGRLYTADFTPPDRCTLPQINASTIAQWIGAENSGTTIDNQEGTAGIDGTQADCDFGACPPSDCACLEIGGFLRPELYYLEFDGLTSDLDCGDNAWVQDLHDAMLTAEAWIRMRDQPLKNGRIIDKVRWFLAFDVTNGLNGFVDCVTQDATATAGLDDLTTDGEWHHVAMTWNDATFNFPRLWVDGTQVTYASTQNRIGAIVSDIGFDLHVGNRDGLIGPFEGDIGWCRVSDSVRYAANFTPPGRCYLPPIDLSTVAQWIGPESSGTAIDNQEGTAGIDGTQTDCTFLDTECAEFGREETCLDEVYIANKHNVAQLTHVFVDNGGAFGSNLIGVVTPYNLLPAVPVAGDAAYFGIDTSIAEMSGPFNSLVFDIQVAITGVTSTLWEYWNGAAWVNIATIQDNTDAAGAMTGVAFDTAGVGSVHWDPPAAWVPILVNGVTGYWVRLRVLVAAGATAPVQQNRNVYTILWPYIEVDGDQVGGDIPLLAEFLVTNQAGATAAGATIVDVLIGMRRLDRGVDFTAFLNVADEQNPTGLTVSLGGNTTFQTVVEIAPSGRVARFAPPAAAGLLTRVVFAFSQSLSSQFYGVYHAYVRLQQNGGSAGDFEVALEIDFGSPQIFGPTAVPTGNRRFIDFGRVEIAPIVAAAGDVFNAPVINLQASNSEAAAPGTLDFIDLVLIPVDEFAVKATSFIGGETFDWGETINVDSIENPKIRIRTLKRDPDDDSIISTWTSITPSDAILQANANQRAWFFQSKEDDQNSPFQGHSVRMFAVNRYLYARGRR